MNKSVLVALSGGLDSTVTALILKQKGYIVTGINFILYKSDKNIEVQNQISKIAQGLGIQHVTINLQNELDEKVIYYFSEEYANGCTPCPCSFCNEKIKWKNLIDYANEHNFDFVATGHYVNIIIHEGLHRIAKGVDPVKDQSYFLWRLPPDYLSKTITPLGNYTKAEVRIIASNNGFDYLSKKPESMGICFLQGTDYRSFLNRIITCKTDQVGDIIDKEGEKRGVHKGIINYTIGQKRWLENIPKNYCVTNIFQETNQIEVGPWDSLYYNKLYLKGCLFPGLKEGYHSGLQVKIRGIGRNPQALCSINLKSNGEAIVNLNDTAWGPMPGQPSVFYKNNILVGGGYLYKAEKT